MHSFGSHLFLEVNMNKEEYDNLLKKKKELRDELFNLRLDYEFNKKNDSKQKEILKKINVLKKTYARTTVLIVEYEIRNNIEKESRKKDDKYKRK